MPCCAMISVIVNIGFVALSIVLEVDDKSPSRFKGA